MNTFPCLQSKAGLLNAAIQITLKQVNDRVGVLGIVSKRTSLLNNVKPPTGHFGLDHVNSNMVCTSQVPLWGTIAKQELAFKYISQSRLVFTNLQ